MEDYLSHHLGSLCQCFSYIVTIEVIFNVSSEEDEDGVRMMVTCGKLTLSPSQWPSGELSDNLEDLEIQMRA